MTSDNPRSERPARIIADIVKGIPAGVGFEIIEDRTAAIRFAMPMPRLQTWCWQEKVMKVIRK
ncbi:MAG: hypothetical protein R3F38_05195 [Gammaproteobacteria bacterium]